MWEEHEGQRFGRRPFVSVGRVSDGRSLEVSEAGVKGADTDPAADELSSTIDESVLTDAGRSSSSQSSVPHGAVRKRSSQKRSCSSPGGSSYSSKSGFKEAQNSVMAGWMATWRLVVGGLSGCVAGGVSPTVVPGG